MTRDELIGKFGFLSEETPGEERTQQVIDPLAYLDILDEVQKFTELLGEGL